MRQVGIVLLSLLSVAAWAQSTQSAAPTIASAVDSEISLVEKEVVEAAEAMPEDKFNFSPESLHIPGADFKGVRTFAWEITHVAYSNYVLWSPLTGDKVPEKYTNHPSERLQTKAEIIQYLKDSFALGHRAAATLTVQNVAQTVGDGKSSRLYLATFGAAHALDHYGQMVEYLRMNGIVPPASRVKPD
jgi:DinB superfamily